MTGCDHPLIAENELFGAQTPTPWSATNAQYRANVLLLLQELAKLGATPAITIANPPYTGGEAADWWREAAKAAILIRQVYFTSPGPKGLYKLGPERASRSMRKGMRGLISRFSEIGIPAGRVALELQFQSAAGQGGRQGLQPRSAWLEFVKLEALAAKQVAAETKIQGVWSWGWPSFSVAGNDPDKGAAACVYLWTRDAKLCDGPKLAGVAFNTSLTEGQISLPAGVRCTLGHEHDPEGGRRPHRGADRRPRLCGERAAAARRCCARRCPSTRRPCSPQSARSSATASVAAARVIAPRCAALHLSVRDARAIVADRLARDLVKTRFRPKPPSSSEVAEFLTTYAGDARSARHREPGRAVARRRRAAALRSRRSRPKRSSRCGRGSSGRSTRSTVASGCARSGLRCRCTRSRRRAR